jgi:CRISPR-associated protein (Cas_Cas02710)
MKILLVTVGGSHQPILKAIRTLNPDRVVFLCSGGDRTSRPQVDGGGKPCEVRRNLKVTEAVEAVSNKLQATFSKTLEKYQIDNAELLDLLETDVKSALRPFDDHIVHIEPVANIVQLANLQERFDPERDIHIIDDLDVALLPESVQPKYEALRISQGKIKIALDRSYELLVDIGSDPLGALYSERRSRILNALQVRNHSLFAHGFQPITQSDYKVFCDVIVTFIREGIATVVPAKHKVAIQFPGVISL